MACCGLFFATSAFETIGRRSLRDKVKTEKKRKLAAHGLCTGGVKRRISEQVAGHVVLAEDSGRGPGLEVAEQQAAGYGRLTRRDSASRPGPERGRHQVQEEPNSNCPHPCATQVEARLAVFHRVLPAQVCACPNSAGTVPSPSSRSP